ncbi:hypothetical protein AB0O67_27360, partial [Streptomyces sp. NPDC086077]
GFLEYRASQDGREAAWYTAHDLDSLNDIRNYAPRRGGRGRPTTCSPPMGPVAAPVPKWPGRTRH